MLRIMAALSIAVVAGGCSLGTASIPLGFGDSGASKSTPPTRYLSGSLGDAASDRSVSARPNRPAPGTQVASLADQAPPRSFEKAPKGALSDRDYGGTSLDVDSAREAINAYRKSKGLKPLTLNAELTKAAKLHSRDLAKWDRISHYGSDGSNPWDRVKRTGYRARLAAENVGTGQASFDEVMSGWKQSPGHNKNLLLADAEHMGIALVRDPKTEFKTFWTLVLGSSM